MKNRTLSIVTTQEEIRFKGTPAQFFQRAEDTMKQGLKERAYEEWKNLPMPSFNQNHVSDRPKYQLEDEAIRGQIKWVARKYGLTFKELDDYIELAGVLNG